MSSIFISHSSKDGDFATEFQTFLQDKGYQSIFLDFDPQNGIPAGRDWEQELYNQLRLSKAVLILCSENSMSSNWCFAEITHAKALGKHIVPIKIGDCVINTILTSKQVLDFTQGKSDGFERLLNSLKLAGLDSQGMFEWDRTRPPYPGLMSFEEEDAAIFFGREKEIQQIIERISKIYQFGGTKSIMVLGSSGSGKSSLVKSGVLPRLKKDKERWLVIPPFRHGSDPIRELAIALSELSSEANTNLSWKETYKRFKDVGNSIDGMNEVFYELIDEVIIKLGKSNAKVILTIDQAEELIDPKNNATNTNFVLFLNELLTNPKGKVILLTTMRSDFLNDFQLNPATRILEFNSEYIGPLSKDNLIRVIEGPAEMIGLTLENGLAKIMMDDAETDDALPLLAFTLREMYEKYGGDNKLTIEEYRDKLGGLSGSIAQAAQAAFSSAKMTPEQTTDFRKAFRAMARINEEGQFARQPVKYSELPESVSPILEQFVQARMLVARSDGDHKFLEVAHEALLRKWKLLRGWLDEDREFLLWKQRLKLALENWVRTDKDAGGLLRGTFLVEAQKHVKEHNDELLKEEKEFIQHSETMYKKELQNKEQTRKRNKKRLQVFLVGAVLLSALAVWQWFSAVAANSSAESAKIEAIREKESAVASEQKAKLAEQNALTSKNETELALKKVNSAQIITFREMMVSSWLAASFFGEVDGMSNSSIFGVRPLYEKMKVIMDLPKISNVSPLPIFISGPHDTEYNFRSSTEFAYYNPEFIEWAKDNLIPAKEDSNLKKLTQPVYNQYLKIMSRYYYMSYVYLKNNPETKQTLTNEYLQFIEEQKNGTSKVSSPQEIFRSTADHLASGGLGYSISGSMYQWSDGSLDWYFANVSPSFWVRRSINGNDERFFEVLKTLIETYDESFLNLPEANGKIPVNGVDPMYNARY